MRAAPGKKTRRALARNATAEAAAAILDALEHAHPEAECALHYKNAYELAVATILSAQCTDKRVNMVTPSVFARYPTPPDLAVAKPAELEELIRTTGFFRAKAKSLTGCAKALVERHESHVPRSLAALVKLPGIGRKTANVVLGHAFGINEGIAVDTHVLRVANRIGLVRGDDPVKVEAQLMEIVDRSRWTRTTDLLIFHGRKVCDARRPRCGECPLFSVCAWDGKQAHAFTTAREAQRPAHRAKAAARPAGRRALRARRPARRRVS